MVRLSYTSPSKCNLRCCLWTCFRDVFFVENTTHPSANNSIHIGKIYPQVASPSTTTLLKTFRQPGKILKTYRTPGWSSHPNLLYKSPNPTQKKLRKITWEKNSWKQRWKNWTSKIPAKIKLCYIYIYSLGGCKLPNLSHLEVVTSFNPSTSAFVISTRRSSVRSSSGVRLTVLPASVGGWIPAT